MSAVDDADWFDGEGRDARERAFLTRLRAHGEVWRSLDLQPGLTYAWFDEPFLRCSIDRGDDERRLIVATLRADLLSDSVQAGFSSSCMFHELRSGLPSIRVDQGESIEEAADRVVTFLAEQIRRPLERHEWVEAGRVVHGCYVLADVSRELCWWDNKNEPRDMGRAPDRVVRIR